MSIKLRDFSEGQMLLFTENLLIKMEQMLVRFINFGLEPINYYKCYFNPF
jgi:hypothetical protein